MSDHDSYSDYKSFPQDRPQITVLKITIPAHTTMDRLGLSKNLPSQEKTIIEIALTESGGRVSGPSGAAAKLGIPGSTLESKIR